ncbi:MAG TPA: hypothetical protein VFV79_08295 [Saprospiraceae bacterium]|nr:hypothetical protein [Saprospiraceae bacterium]
MKTDLIKRRLHTIKFVLILSAVTTLWSCNNNDLDLFVDPALQEYMDRFKVEGAARGVTVDYVESRIAAYLRIITQSGVIGQCAHSDKEENTVIIDRMYFESATDLEKEFVVFHELGHCVLNREHLDQADNQGKCISIMTSGVGGCIINYTEATRKGLLDELFQ